MVFRFQRRGTQEISLSEWNGAVEEALTTTGVAATNISARSGVTADDSSPDASENFLDQAAPAPEMNIGAIRAQIEREKSDDSDDDDKIAQVSISAPGDQSNRNYNRRTSFNQLLKPKRPSIDHTVGTSSSASRLSYSSSAGSNIWSKLLGSQSGLWDGLGGKNVYDDEDFDDDGVLGMDGGNGAKYCRENLRLCGLAWWYETRHFVKTIWKHPHILLASLVAFVVVCGVGMVAINSEKNYYVQKQLSLAEFVVSCKPFVHLRQIFFLLLWIFFSHASWTFLPTLPPFLGA